MNGRARREYLAVMVKCQKRKGTLNKQSIALLLLWHALLIRKFLDSLRSDPCNDVIIMNSETSLDLIMDI
eukprot:scaffold9308_cov115-Cylindrotheca_fusiformis.AAC.6